MDTREVGGDWTVRFPPGWGAPSQKVFPELISWTDDPDDGIKHFSGTATYEKTIEVPAEWLTDNRHIHLDLGQVRVTAVVRPEYARLKAGADKQGDLDGILENIVYFGTDTHYHVRLPDESLFVTRRQNQREDTEILEVGQQVTVAFKSNSVQVLRD